MLETLAGWNEDIAEGVFAFEETVERSTTAIISPGVRYAFNLPNDAQLVIGAALPIGLTSDSPDWGIVLLLLIRASIRTDRTSPNKITSAVDRQVEIWDAA